MSTRLTVFDHAGSFAENKDVARSLRERIVAPAVHSGEELTIDFEGVDLSTQSFIHALLSEIIRTNGDAALELLDFKNCNASVRNLVEIVADYSQDTFDGR